MCRHYHFHGRVNNADSDHPLPKRGHSIDKLKTNQSSPKIKGELRPKLLSPTKIEQSLFRDENCIS